MVTLDQLLESCVYNSGSELHLKANSSPLVRIYGDLLPLDLDPLTHEEVRSLCLSALTEDQKARFEEAMKLDFAYEIEGIARFHGNIYLQRGYAGGAFHVIPY